MCFGRFKYAPLRRVHLFAYARYLISINICPNSVVYRMEIRHSDVSVQECEPVIVNVVHEITRQ